MEPIQDPFDTTVPSTNDVLHDVIQTGRVMFAAGERLLRNLDYLRGRAKEESDWRFEFTDHKYLWVAASVGACLLLAAMLRPRPSDARRDPVAY
jgi:hypothetical protein